jgi:hypothetical protein
MHIKSQMNQGQNKEYQAIENSLQSIKRIISETANDSAPKSLQMSHGAGDLMSNSKTTSQRELQLLKIRHNLNM